MLGQHRDAVMFLTGFLDKQRASLETLLSLGSGFLGLRDYPRALGLFERLAAAKPPAPKALIGKGLALSGENRHEEALAALDPDRRHDIVMNLQGDHPVLRGHLEKTRDRRRRSAHGQRGFLLRHL